LIEKKRKKEKILNADHTTKRPPTEQADIWGESLPYPIDLAFSVYLTQRISAVDKEMLEGLDKAGFEVYKGIDNGGISRLYYTRGGGYYIDVGASKHIINGNIKVRKSPEGIKGFEPHDLVLADGKKLDADFVVLATGFDNMRTTVRKVLGDKVADRCKDVWDLDEEGELQAVSIPQLEYMS
jgi:hypothetical protein